MVFAASRRPLVLLGVVVLVGFGVPYLANGVAVAHATASDGPKPDPPPPPPPPPRPIPPPAYVPPPPPPPAYVPPPPPPPAYTPPSKPKPKAKPRQAKPKKKQAVVVSSTWLPRPPDAPLATIAPVTVSAEAGSGSSVFLLLAIALVLSLIVVGVAATPPWLIPRHVNVAAYEHRDTVIAGGAAVALSIAIGVAIVLVGS